MKDKTIAQIARIVVMNWEKPYFGAVPYLQAMHELQSIDDNYHYDSGRSVVAYFLANAGTWRGDVAREVKKELNRRLK